MNRTVIGFVLFVLVSQAHAEDRWPKEIRDGARVRCTAMVVKDSANPAAIQAQADDYCTCLIEGMQGTVSFADFQQSMTLPPEQFAQLPAGRAMQAVVQRCTR